MLWYAALVAMIVTGALMLGGAWSDWAAPRGSARWPSW